MGKLKKIYFATSGLALLAPLIALAAPLLPSAPGGLSDLSSGRGPAPVLIFIIDLILGFAALTAVLFLIIGGYQYILSGANEETAEQGKKTIQNAVIGIIIIILSYTIISIIYASIG